MMNVDKTQIRPDGSTITPEEFHFNLECGKCGSKRTRMIPTSYYNNPSQKNANYVTMHLLCTECHNELEYVVCINKEVN